MSETSVCFECGQTYPTVEMIQYEGKWICAGCKPAFVQKIREGVGVSTGMNYGGFWIRFGAKFIDGIVLGLISLVVAIPISALTMSAAADNSGQMIIYVVLQQIVQFAINVSYSTFFLGKFAATPGKMACKLKVLTPDGGRITYMRAFGRALAEWVSAMILGIGYLMAAFDDEKRTLHDRMCATRVVQS